METNWTVASAPAVKSGAIAGDVVYAIGADQFLHKQRLSTMTSDSPWQKANAERQLGSIAIYDGMIYATGTDKKVYKQLLIEMDFQTTWLPVERANPANGWLDLAVVNGYMYAVGQLGLMS